MPRLRIPKTKSKKTASKPSMKKTLEKFRKGLALRKKMIAEGKEGVSLEGLSGQFSFPPFGYPMPGASTGEPEHTKGEEAIVHRKGTEGIEIPTEISVLKPLDLSKEERERLVNINSSYKLIEGTTETGKNIFAFANIKWEPSVREVLYNVIEPPITDIDYQLIQDVKRKLEERLDVDFTKLGVVKSEEILREEILNILSEIPGIDMAKANVLIYYIEKDIIGLGKIEPLMKDPNIEDISCDGIEVPIYVYHRDPRLASMKTNIVFKSKEELDSFVLRLSQKCNKTISIAEPLLDGTLTDGSRVQATLGTDIARKGSNFTIRKFTEKPLTPIHMLKFGTLNSLSLAYLWMSVEHGKSILISGGTATGKTSLLNALSLFIQPTAKVVSIEDTSELRLTHPHWIPEVARSALGIKSKVGEVTLFDLLKSSLRQRPDYIVLGEVRGKEAFVLFQQMASIPGDQEVLVLNDNHLKRIPIKDLNVGKSFRVPTINESGHVEIAPLKCKVDHSPVKELYKIYTKTGREIVTSGNHSVFKYKDGIEPAVVSELEKGDEILIPAKLPSGFNDIDSLNLIESLPNIRVYAPQYIRKAARNIGFEEASKIAGFTTISNYYGVNNCALPSASFIKLMRESRTKYDPDKIKVRFERRSFSFPAALPITPELLRLIGYYISEGSLNTAHKNNSISLYSSNKEILKDMEKCIIGVTGNPPKKRSIHGYGESTELKFNHKVLFELLKNTCKHKSQNKKIPDFIFGLSQEKISHILSGLYSGDAYLGNKYFGYYTISKQLANDVSLLLLTMGIVSRIRERKRKGRKTSDYEIVFYKHSERKKFLSHVKPIGKRIKLQNVKDRKEHRKINDTYRDEIERIVKIKLNRPEPIYDLSVPGNQNFIGGFGGILLHNTGHPSLATIHAASLSQLIDRLITPPISLPPTLVENVDIIVFLVLTKLKGVYKRRTNTIEEVIGVKGQKPITNEVFRWNPSADDLVNKNKSVLMMDVAQRAGIDHVAIKDEIVRRRIILEWMLEQEIFDYREVSKVINTYYTAPERLVDLISRYE